jgi:hypothetical protein
MSIIHCAFVLYFASRLNSIQFSPLACSKIPLKCLLKTVDTCHSCVILFFFIIYSLKVQIKYIADTRLQERNQEKHMVIWL